MSLTTVSAATPSTRKGSQDAVRAAVKELQGLKSAVIAGGAAAAQLTVTGIATADKIVSVIRLDIATDTGTSATGNKVQDVSDLTAEASIPAANKIALSTTDTTGDKLLVLYIDVA